MNAPSKDSPENNGHQKFLVLVATTTREKVDQYRTIAREKHLPIEFRALTEVERYFHAAPENTGDRVENAEQKLGEIKEIIAAFRQPGSANREALKRKCAQWDVSFDTHNIYFATDDSTFTVRKDIWKPFKALLEPYVESDLLKPKKPRKINKNYPKRDDSEVGPGAEFGPIVSAVGVTRFFDLLRQAAHEAHYNDDHVGITNHVTLLLHCLDGSPSEPPIKVEAKQPVFLHSPKGLKKPFEEPDVIAKSEHFMHAKGKYAPISDYWQHYLVEQHERAQVVDELAAKVLKCKVNGQTPGHESFSGDTGHDFTVGLPTMRDYGKFVHNLLNSGVKLAIPDDVYFGDEGNAAKRRRPHQALSLESVMAKSDALLFTPFDPSDGAEVRTANYLALFSAKVAKQLIARDMNKPIVIMNLNNCWQNAIDTSLDLVNKGMFKDHLRAPYEEGVPPQTRGVEHSATRFFDVLTSDNPEKLRKAAIKMLEHRRREYIPFTDPESALRQDAFSSGGTPPPKGMFKVAVFVSASNDNRRLLTDMRGLGHDLADQQFGLVWGGGDRHGMGAVYEGYKQFKETNPHKKTWMAAFSTEPILKSETEHGRIPSGVDYWEQNVDIYQRMAHMIHKNDDIQSNAIVVAPGGDGTMQEWLATLELKRQFPNLMKGKSLILYTPDLHGGNAAKGEAKPFWEQGIKTVMGKSFYKTIIEKHRAYADEGIYLATDQKELMDLLKHLRGDESKTHVERARGRGSPTKEGPAL